MPIPETGPKAATVAFLPILAYLAAVLLVAWPFFDQTYLPVVDAPNHLARHFLSGPGGADPALAQYYTYNWALVPNSAVDAIVYLLGHPTDLLAFHRYVAIFYMANLMAAAMVLSRVIHGCWSIWPLVAALFVFNGPFFWGFQNYLFTIPFTIYGLALWLVTAHWAIWARVLLFMPVAFAIFFMHFFAFAAFVILAFGVETQRLLSRPWREILPEAIRAVPLALPIILPLAYLILVVSTGDNPAGSRTEFGNFLYTRIYALNSTVQGDLDLSFPNVRTTGNLILLFLLAMIFATSRRRSFRLVIAPQMQGPLIAALVFAVAAPFWLNGVALVHIRLPFLIAILFFAATRWQNLNQRAGICLCIIVAALALMRGIEINRMANGHDREVTAILSLMENVEPGARVLPISSMRTAATRRRNHVQGYAVTQHRVFVPTLFQGVHALQLRPEWHDYAHAYHPPPDVVTVFYPEQDPEIEFRDAYLDDWQNKFHYVLFIDPDARPTVGPEQGVSEIAEQDGFRLYRVMTDG